MRDLGELFPIKGKNTRQGTDDEMKERRLALLEDAATALERVRLRAFEAGATEVVQITHSIAELLNSLLRR